MTLFFRSIVVCLLMGGVGLFSAWGQMDVETLKKGVVKITTEFSNARKIGIFQDFPNMIPVAISLMRTNESPPAFSDLGLADFSSIQNFGR